MNKHKFVMQDQIWAGTESSLEAYMASAESVAERMSAGVYPEDEDDEDDLPDLLQIQNGVGILSIHGPLTNSDSRWNKFFGITSYGAIREAMMYAANSPEVESILLDVNSGGGAVNGVDDAAKLISMVDKNVKPVVAYTDGAMCSAAYWLGCSAREVYASNVAITGSIGVISTHRERSKQLKEDGIGVTVMRSGKFKALANGVEPLTSDAKAQIQGQLDAVYSIFLGHVASARGKSADAADATMAQGREFIGQQAIGAGLVDGIESFDSVMTKMQKRFAASTGQDNRNFMQGTPMKKQAMTEQELAAIAAGVSVQAATEAESAAVEASIAAEGDANVEANAKAVEEGAGEAAAAVENKESALVSYLQSEVKSKDAALLEAQIESRDVKAKLAGMEATHNGLLEIVKKAVGQLQIAMGGSALDMSAMDAATVLNEHKRLAADFHKSFKAGGVAAVDAGRSEKNVPQIDPRHKALVGAVRFSK